MPDDQDPAGEPDSTDDSDASQGGEVSEVASLKSAGEPVDDDQAVAGSPGDESGDVQEGSTGPNARTGSDRA